MLWRANEQREFVDDFLIVDFLIVDFSNCKGVVINVFKDICRDLSSPQMFQALHNTMYIRQWLHGLLSSWWTTTPRWLGIRMGRQSEDLWLNYRFGNFIILDFIISLKPGLNFYSYEKSRLDRTCDNSLGVRSLVDASKKDTARPYTLYLPGL